MNCADKPSSAYRKGLQSILVFCTLEIFSKPNLHWLLQKVGLIPKKSVQGTCSNISSTPGSQHSLQEREPGCVLKSSCELRGYAKGMCSDSPLGRGDFQILSSFALHLNRFKLLQIYVTRPNFSQGTGWTVMMKESRHSNISFHCFVAIHAIGSALGLPYPPLIVSLQLYCL